jgi:hypothetical protein
MYPSFTPPITKRFQIESILPFSWTKKISETVALTRVSRGAAEKPWTSLIKVRERKLCHNWSAQISMSLRCH